MKKAFIKRISWLFGISQILISVKDVATVDVLWGMIYTGDSS